MSLKLCSRINSWSCVDQFVCFIIWVLSVRVLLGRLLSCCQYDGLMQDSNMSIANALEILQSCTKTSNIYLLEIQVLPSLLTPAIDTGSPLVLPVMTNYRQTSNISRTLEGNKLVNHSDVVGASPVGGAPTTSSFSTSHLASMDTAKTTARRGEDHISFGFSASYI